MIIFGHFLRERRQHLGQSIRECARKADISPQSISSYERLISMPVEETLPRIAKAYDLELGEVRKVFFQSVSRQAENPVLIESFLNFLMSIQSGEHIVVISQTILAINNQDIPVAMSEVLKNGAYLTYLYCNPANTGVSPITSPWKSNHRTEASMLWRALQRHEPGGCLSNIKFLEISNPDSDDLGFINPFFGMVYICRSAEDLSKNDLFHELAQGDSVKWYSLPREMIESYHYWITNKCGYGVPTDRFGKPAAKVGELREASIFTLPEILGI